MGRSRREVGQRNRSQMRKPALVRRKRRRMRRKRRRTEKKRKRRKMERRIEEGVQIQILALDLPQEICILVRTFIWSFFVWCSIDPFCNNDFSFCCHSLNSICYNNWINIQPQPWLHRINVFWLQHWQVIPRSFLLYPSGALATPFSRFGAMLSLFHFDSVFILQNRIVNWRINRDKH